MVRGFSSLTRPCVLQPISVHGSDGIPGLITCRANFGFLALSRRDGWLFGAESIVPSGLVIIWLRPGVETPGYSHLSLRDKPA